MSRQNRGFTLVEVLVVLTMVSLLSALLFQGFGYMLATYDRLQNRQSAEMQKSLAEGWWRDSVEASVPYYDNPLRFAGDTQSIQGASYSPMWRSPGVPSRMTWRLEQQRDGLHLVYEEPPYPPVTIRRWDPGASAAFSFLTKEGQWQADWLPARDRQLPEAVRLAIEERTSGGSQLYTMTAVVPVRKSQFIPTTDILYGRE